MTVLEGEVGENEVEKYNECVMACFPQFRERHNFKDSRSSANPKKVEKKTLGISVKPLKTKHN